MSFRGALFWMALVLAGCSADPRVGGLQEGMSMMEALVQKPELATLASQQKGSPAQARVAALFSPEAASLWPARAPSEVAFDSPHPPGTLPPRIAFLPAPDVSWCVVIKAEEGQVDLEGYGASLDQPLLRRHLKL